MVMGNILKKRIILTLVLFWFIPQVYVIMDCLSKGPCAYNYKFNITLLILWDLLPSLFTDFFVILTFLVLLIIAICLSFLISTFVIKK